MLDFARVGRADGGHRVREHHAGLEEVQAVVFELAGVVQVGRQPGFHLEHHLNAKKPWFELKTVSLQRRPDFIQKGHYTIGLRGLWKELVLRS